MFLSFLPSIASLLDNIPPSKTEVLGYILAVFLPIILGLGWPFLIIPWICYFILFIYRQFLAPQYLPARGKVVYITGCDSGFGHSIAQLLDDKGCYVFAGCLNVKGDGAQQLRANCSERLTLLDLDVTDQTKVNTCANKIREFCDKNSFTGLWALYNNAGIAMAGEIEWISMETYHQSMDINFWGTVRVTKSVLPLIRRAKGRVVTVTSGISTAVQPGRSPYGCSKAALNAFMDTLRYEMRKFGVHCSTVIPGNLTASTKVFTGMAEKIDKLIDKIDPKIEEDYGEKYLEAFRQSIATGYRGQGIFPVSVVVDAINHAILSKTPRSIYKPAQFGWIVWWIVYSLLPTHITDLMQAYWHRYLPKPASVMD